MNDNFVIANRTDTGCTRQVNEDCMVTFDSPNGRVVAVCDGMGGQAAGDVASRLACDIIADILENNTFASPSEAITRAVMAANQGILHRAAQDPALEGMGATCVMAIIKDGAVTYGWIGDSRIYYISNHLIRQISRDQSYVQSLVDSGQITAQQAENHPRKNEIINALGLESMTPPEICTMPLLPESGSILMLCSDGLSGVVSAQSMEHILSDPDLSLQEKADRLVARANSNGGPDNITVQLVQFGSPDKAAAAVGKKATMMVAGVIAAVVLVAAVVLALVLGGGSDKDKKTAVSGKQTETVDKRHKPTPKPSPTVSSRPTQQTTIVEQPSQKANKVKKTTNVKTDPAEALGNQSNTKRGEIGSKTESQQSETTGILGEKDL